jgi:flagellar biosynthesis/type III secretory pathway chaperone
MRIAHRQAKVSEGQLVQMSRQNDILMQQLAQNADQLAFQRKQAQSEADAEATTAQREEHRAIEDAEPVYYFKIISASNGWLLESMEEIKKTGVIAEIKSSLRDTRLVSSLPPDRYKRTLNIPIKSAVCYLLISA